MENDTTTQVFAGELWKATMLKNVLDDNNIPAFLNNEILSTVVPYLGGMDNVKVIVDSQQADEALKLIAEFDKGEVE